MTYPTLLLNTQAPEAFDERYSYPSDVWSAGVMMYELLTGELPFKSKNTLDLSREVS
jgi:serine/threonine protein kinase